MDFKKYQEKFKINKLDGEFRKQIYEFTPDIICLENACSLAGNLPMIKKLLDCGIEPNKKCLENVSFSL